MRIASMVLSAAAAMCATAACASAQANTARMDQIAQFYANSDDHFMGSVLVARDGRIEFDKGYGYADIEWHAPNTADTKFRLGSLTKQFTAASILLLEERGKLKTDDLVKQYMPDAPAAWDHITIYHVLTHTSGIPNFTGFPSYDTVKATRRTPEQMVALFRDKPLDFQPGEKWNYSNSGYVLLGYLIEKISGQKYEDFIQENLFKPLGMTNTGYDWRATILPQRASGYSMGEHGLVNADYIDMSIPYSAGSLYSTTHDLLKWEQGLFGGKVLSAASLKKMTTPYKHNYGCGVAITTKNGHTRIAHTGGIDGFSTDMAYYPDEKITVIALSNLLSGDVVTVATKLEAVEHRENVVLPNERQVVSVPATVLAGYAGTYQLQPGYNLTVTLDGGKLMVAQPRQPTSQLFASSPTKFYLGIQDTEIEFVDKGLVMRMGDDSYHATKQ